jgi:hypothetical protein
MDGVTSNYQHIVEHDYRVVRGADDARATVREAAVQGVDHIKIYANAPPNPAYLSVEEMRAIVEEAHPGTLAVLILQSAAPSRMRARITSFYVLMGNLVGLTMGPPLSAWISQHVFEGPNAVRSALSLIGAMVCPVMC